MSLHHTPMMRVKVITPERFSKIDYMRHKKRPPRGPGMAVNKDTNLRCFGYLGNLILLPVGTYRRHTSGLPKLWFNPDPDYMASG